ncbi:MAG: cation:proton antiporter [Rickettsiales bacterium]
MHDLSFLPNILLILATAVVIVVIFRKFHLSPVLGYFVAGAAIGEHGFNIVTAKETEVFGEFGVVFLLFAIGLELTFERLKSMRTHVFGFGGLQVAITSAVIFALAYFFNIDSKAAIVIGGGFALSSTAIVLQVVGEQRRQSTQVGRLSLAVLLMQDFAVVPLLVLIPLLAGTGGVSDDLGNLMGMAMVRAVFALLLIFVAGRLFLRPIFRLINSTITSKNNELFIAATLLIVLTSAWVTDKLGLSMALGAFVAGLLVAETEYHLQAEESIMPFKSLLLGLFFMTVGMSLNLKLIVQEVNVIALSSLALIMIKFLIIMGLGLLFRFNLGTAIHAGLMLAQGSEFAFIMFGMAVDQKIIAGHAGQILMIVVTITMALTPLLSMIGDFISDKLDKKDRMDHDEINKDVADLDNHVIIIGFGRVGKMVARLLEAEKVNYIAVDINSNHVIHERKEGFPLYLGDASNAELLKAVGIERSKSVILTIDNRVTSKKCTKVIRENMNDLPIVVRSKDLSDEEDWYKAGASMIVPETYETGLQMGGAVLKSVGISENEVSRIKNQFRKGNYIMALDEESEPDDVSDEFDYGYNKKTNE